jgi:hypothetical protein
MRKFLQIAATILVLAASLSTASFADEAVRCHCVLQTSRIACCDNSALI